MHDVLRQRLMRAIEGLPDEQVYQVLDFVEFLESKYARDLQVESSGLQRFAENLEDRMRRKAMNPATLREAFQLIASADKVLSNVSNAGRQILDDLGAVVDEEGAPARRPPGARRGEGEARSGARSGAGSGVPSGGEGREAGSRDRPRRGPGPEEGRRDTEGGGSARP
jgi:hypothetical protein